MSIKKKAPVKKAAAKKPIPAKKIVAPAPKKAEPVKKVVAPAPRKKIAPAPPVLKKAPVKKAAPAPKKPEVKKVVKAVATKFVEVTKPPVTEMIRATPIEEKASKKESAKLESVIKEIKKTLLFLQPHLEASTRVHSLSEITAEVDKAVKNLGISEEYDIVIERDGDKARIRVYVGEGYATIHIPQGKIYEYIN